MKCKLIPDYPNYRIWEDGTVESCYKLKTNKVTDTWRQVKWVFDKSSGYFVVTLCHGKTRQNKRVHRLMAEAFIPNPENKPHVNHKNLIKTDNWLDNFEWATEQENTIHALKMGARDLSKNHNKEVLQLDKETREVIAEYISLHEAGRVTSTQWQNIWKVCDGRRKSAGSYAWAYK